MPWHHKLSLKCETNKFLNILCAEYNINQHICIGISSKIYLRKFGKKVVGQRLEVCSSAVIDRKRRAWHSITQWTWIIYIYIIIYVHFKQLVQLVIDKMNLHVEDWAGEAGDGLAREAEVRPQVCPWQHLQHLRLRRVLDHEIAAANPRIWAANKGVNLVIVCALSLSLSLPLSFSPRTDIFWGKGI